MREFVFAVFVCWFFNALAVYWVRVIRLKNKEHFAGVWFGTLPRLGGMMLTVAALMFFLDTETSRRYTFSLVWVYLVSLPFAVWLTLPKDK